jgi:hypothetical protein
MNTRRKTLLIAVSLAVAFTIPVLAEAAPDILWDQPFQMGGRASEYYPDLGGGIYSADDFSNASPWNIERVFVHGWDPGHGVQKAYTLNWLIYPDAGGVPAGHPEDGGELWSHSCKPSDPEVTIGIPGPPGAHSRGVTLDIIKAQGVPLYLPPGTYWLVFYPSLAARDGWWYWRAADTDNVAVAQVMSPTGYIYPASWTPITTYSASDHDLAFRLEGTVQGPLRQKYLHAEGGLFNLTDPIGTQWHELWPIFCREYHLGSWEDNGDGVLSPSDQIDMYEKPDGEVRWYHVDEVTITLFLRPMERGEPMYIELEGGYDLDILTDPVDTQWHEIYPVFCREYHLIDWSWGRKLEPCEDIFLVNKQTREETWWHVEEVAIDIIVTIKPPPVGGEAYPVSKMSLLAPWIGVAVLLSGGISWYVLKRRRARS